MSGSVESAARGTNGQSSSQHTWTREFPYFLSSHRNKRPGNGAGGHLEPSSPSAPLEKLRVFLYTRGLEHDGRAFLLYAAVPHLGCLVWCGWFHLASVSMKNKYGSYALFIYSGVCCGFRSVQRSSRSHSRRPVAIKIHGFGG